MHRSLDGQYAHAIEDRLRSYNACCPYDRKCKIHRYPQHDMISYENDKECKGDCVSIGKDAAKQSEIAESAD